MSQQRVLITGVGGFSGRHLAAHLRGGAVLAGLGAGPATSAPVDRYYACDLTDGRAVATAIDDFRPDAVYHLAACPATDSAARQQAVIVDGFRNLCAALQTTAKQDRRRIRLLTIGSAAELGPAGVARLPVGENAPCEPATPYGRAKADVTALVQNGPKQGLLETIVARTFNLVGPGMSAQLSLGRFAEQIGAVRRGETDRIRCGNLAHRRDFTDVRDAVRAYAAILARGRTGQVYNVCSGRSHAMRDLLEQMLQIAELRIPIECETTGLRPGDVKDVYGDVVLTWKQCGWRAALPMERSLRDLLSAAVVDDRDGTGRSIPYSHSA